MMKRLFVAIKIEPSEKFRNVLHDLQLRLKGEAIKWVPAGNMHITLKFIGETPEEMIPGIMTAIASAVSMNRVFLFPLSGTGIFGSRYTPRVIWFGTGNNENLRGLAEGMLTAFDEIGMTRDRQNLVPHLTVARIRFIKDNILFRKVINLYQNEAIQDVKVEEVVLYESILKPQGPDYIRLFTVKLPK